MTVENLHEYILKDHPLHPAYEFLSETHRCDILRTYFMYHYGGGYSDIKIPNGSWVKGFEDMENDNSLTAEALIYAYTFDGFSYYPIALWLHLQNKVRNCCEGT